MPPSPVGDKAEAACRPVSPTDPSFFDGALYRRPKTAIQLMYLHLSAPFKRATIAFGVATACIACSIFLRAATGNRLREAITLGLGHEGRAAVEHLLAAIGVPLATAFWFLAVLLTFCWASYAVCKWVGCPWKSLAKHPSEIASFEDFACHVCVWSAIYVVTAGVWEWEQAFVGVYGGAARGHIQWEQVCGDVLGALVALGIALRRRGISGAFNRIGLCAILRKLVPVSH